MSYNNDIGKTYGITRVFTFCPYYERAGGYREMIMKLRVLEEAEKERKQGKKKKNKRGCGMTG